MLYLNSEGRKVLLLESGRSDGVDAGLGEIHNNWGASGLTIFNADYGCIVYLVRSTSVFYDLRYLMVIIVNIG